MTDKAAMSPFYPFTAPHPAQRKRAKELCLQLNQLPVQALAQRRPIYEKLFGKVSSAFIEPDFFCDYGHNIFLGEQFFANHHCLMLDAARIDIGDHVMLGPAVHLYTTTHPLNARERAAGVQMVAPIVIGDDCWIGGQTVVMPGVHIGAGTVIGAGSVVTRSIPAGVVAYGNPCIVHQSIAQ